MIRHRLEPVVVTLPTFHVAVGTSADWMQRCLLLTHRLQILLGGDVLVADELREVGGRLPHAILEVHHHGELVGRLDPVEVAAKERGRSAAGVGLDVLFDRELDVLGRHLAPPFMELHPRTELERPGPHLVRGLPLGSQAGAVFEGFRVSRNERIVHTIPQGLLALDGTPGKRRFRTPAADRHHQAIVRGDGAGAHHERPRRGSDRRRRCRLQKCPTIASSAHSGLLLARRSSPPHAGPCLLPRPTWRPQG